MASWIRKIDPSTRLAILKSLPRQFRTNITDGSPIVDDCPDWPSLIDTARTLAFDTMLASAWSTADCELVKLPSVTFSGWKPASENCGA